MQLTIISVMQGLLSDKKVDHSCFPDAHPSRIGRFLIPCTWRRGERRLVVKNVSEMENLES